MQRKCINNLYVLLLVSTLAACSNSGNINSESNNTTIPAGNVSSLVFTQPYELASFQNTSGNGYIVVSNTDESRSVESINYSLNLVVGGASKVSIDSSSAESCAVIESLGSCVLKLNLESGAFGGSFVLGASNSSEQLSQVKQSLSTTSKMLAKAPIGINTVGTTTTVGINGIKLSYYPVISNNVTSIVVVGTLLSNNTGTYNNALLLDENNQPLALQKVISSNLGAGAANLSQGDSFSISIPAPQENKPLLFKLQMKEIASDGTVSNTATSAILNTLATVSNQAILYNYPSSVGLSSANANQTVAVANIGSVAATAYVVSSSNPSVATVTQPSLSSLVGKNNNRELEADVPIESTSSYTVSLTNPSSSQNASFVINESYNNGKIDVSTNISASSSDSSWPNPAPTPGWSQVGESVQSSGYFTSIIQDGAGNIYAGGYTPNMTGGVWEWNGSAWSQLGGNVTSSVSFGSIIRNRQSGYIYAGGRTVNSNGGLWVWNGSSWSQLGGDITSAYQLSSIIQDEAGNIYAGTQASNSQPQSAGVWKWDGTSWSELGGGNVESALVFTSIIRDDLNNIYAAGSAVTGGGGVWKWNGVSWSQLGTSISAVNLFRSIIRDASGNIYAAGTSSGIFNTRGCVWKWNGTSWSQLGTNVSTISSFGSIVQDLAGNIYAGGQTTGTSSGALWMWNGSSWSQLGSNVTSASAFVSILQGEAGNIYAGGATAGTAYGGVWSYQP